MGKTKAIWALITFLAACATPRPPAEEARELHHEAAQRLSVSNDPAEALELLDRAIRLDPGQADYYATRAVVRRAMGRAEEAEADLGSAIERTQAASDNLAGLHLRRAVLRTELGRNDAAEEDYAETVRLAPDYTEAWLRRARFRRTRGRTDEADRDVAEARRVGARRADAFYNEGVRVFNLQQPDEAETFFGFAADLDPRHAAAWVGLGRVSLELRRFDAAARAIGRAIDLRPRDAELHYHRGNAFLALQRFEEALRDYERALELGPVCAEYYVARGLLRHRHLKDAKRAEEDYTQAIGLDEKSEDAYTYRGLLHQESGRLPEAEADLRRALSLHAGPEGFQRLGRVYLDMGRREQAADVFRKALNACRNDALRASLEEDLRRTGATSNEESSREHVLMDAERARRAPVVLRIRLVSAGGGDKYHWDRVVVLRILKNEAGLVFDGEMEVAHYGWKDGIPEGVSTIYLIPYGERQLNLWQLLDGSGESGVSHASK